MQLTLSKDRCYRLGAALSAAVIASIAFASTPCFAKPKSQSQIFIPADPCAKMKGHLSKRINDMKGLKKTIDKEQSVPNTLAGVFDLMQGKPYIDQPKAQKLAQMRREANNIRDAMQASGCTVIDIDAELAKPPTPTLPTALKKEKGRDDGLEPEIPIRSTY